MKLSKKEEKRLRYRRNMPPRGRFELDFEGAKLFAVAHPWLHMLVCALQWLSFLLPIAAYTLLTLWKEPLNGAWAVLSVLGACSDRFTAGFGIGAAAPIADHAV